MVTLEKAALQDSQALVTMDAIRRVREQVAPYIRQTPIVPLARDASEVGQERLFLKLDNLQVTDQRLSEKETLRLFDIADDA
ncbi:MAG TPA: hypothetical protein EYQ27_21530, partial [Gemmatimonadetes bacterium]|nr:hypothetical protein [Gemmatimonadota bacterium]